MLTEAWWFPIAALVLACFTLTAMAGLMNVLLDKQSHRILGGTLIAALALSAFIVYAYHALSPSPPVDLPPEECPGSPYETC